MANNDNITGTGVNQLDNSNNKETNMDPNNEVICEQCGKHVKEENTYYAECEATICVNCWDTHVLQCPRCTEAVEQERKESAEDQAWANLHMGEKPEPKVEPEQEVLTQAPKEAPKMDTTLKTTTFKIRGPEGQIEIEAYSYSQAQMILGCDHRNYIAQLCAKDILQFVGYKQKGPEDMRQVGYVTAASVESYKHTYRPREVDDEGISGHSYEMRISPEDLVTYRGMIRGLYNQDKEKWTQLLEMLTGAKDLTLMRRTYSQKHNAQKQLKKVHKKVQQGHNVENQILSK